MKMELSKGKLIKEYQRLHEIVERDGAVKNGYLTKDYKALCKVRRAFIKGL